MSKLKDIVGAPNLETDRLILRSHRLVDFDDCKQMWADENVTRHTIGKPSTEQQTWARVLSYLGHWALMGFGYWAIEEKKSRHFVGELGFADFKREMNPSIKGVPEMGWALNPTVHGKGYAAEAIGAALIWGDQSLKSEKIACIINPANTRSIKLAEKIGFKFLCDTKYLETQIKLFNRTRPERGR